MPTKDKPKRGEWECRACKTRKVGDAMPHLRKEYEELRRRELRATTEGRGPFRGCDCSINEVMGIRLPNSETSIYDHPGKNTGKS